MTATRSWLAAAGVGLALLVGAGTAQARSDVYWSVGVGVPGVVIGAGNAAPVYYTPPAPVYYAPPPVVYAPPVYRAPRPVYYAPPVVVSPPVGYYRGHGHGHRRGHHGHRRDWR
ncbi:hypothetical protein [Pulveribacter sp.]|uniref:hypothetical protein n=1 Tax=Pulveribacter sp. TaxID=2678893 RepID=UPI0028A92E8D|nr:hypothetical protein [Pulveribacter sp.]